MRASRSGRSTVRAGASCGSATLSCRAELDTDHRALVRAGGAEAPLHVLSAAQGALRCQRSAAPRPRPLAFAGEHAARVVTRGLEHIFAGLDHILFLLVLLLPALLPRDLQRPQRLHPSWRTRPRCCSRWPRLVTAFTLAHSLTLVPRRARPGQHVGRRDRAGDRGLGGARGAQQPVARCSAPSAGRWPSRSACCTASASRRRWPTRGWRAGAVAALFGFNLGVELGQLAIVLLFVPLACLCAARALYRASCCRAAGRWRSRASRCSGSSNAWREVDDAAMRTLCSVLVLSGSGCSSVPLAARRPAPPPAEPRRSARSRPAPQPLGASAGSASRREATARRSARSEAPRVRAAARGARAARRAARRASVRCSPRRSAPLLRAGGERARSRRVAVRVRRRRAAAAHGRRSRSSASTR